MEKYKDKNHDEEHSFVSSKPQYKKDMIREEKSSKKIAKKFKDDADVFKNCKKALS